MTTLQIKLTDEIATMLQSQAQKAGMSRTSIVKMLIASFLGVFSSSQGNVFHAARDNKGVGIPVEDFEAMLKDPEHYDFENAAWVQEYKEQLADSC